MLLGLTNVRMNAALTERNEKRMAHGDAPFTIPTVLHSVIKKLATDKPLWEFIGSGTSSSQLSVFTIEKDGEKLGEIGMDWRARGACVYAKNKRIADKLTRSDRYKTTDVDKVVLKVKKMFGSMSTNERIAESALKAAQAIQLASSSKWSEVRGVEVHIERVGNQYVMEDGYATFIAWLHTQTSQKAKDTLVAIDNKVRLGIEMLTIEKVRDHLNGGKAVLVIRDGEKYIVKMGDKVDLYDDNTLPQEMRGKLGMLKLVEDGQFVTDTGCRVNAETFVLVLEEVKDES